MERRIEFRISDRDWLAMMWPEYAAKFKDGFRCTYALKEDRRGHQFYELETSDGRTNYNDLNAYEKSCLWDCQKFFENHLHIVGCPPFCTSMKVDGRVVTANGRRKKMTINDMIEMGVTFEGPRVVTSLTDDLRDEQVLYAGEDEWSWTQLDEEWADWDINYIHPRRSLGSKNEIEIELDNPNV